MKNEMAAYAALASLAQTTTLDAVSHLSITTKGYIRSIHEYAIILLTFLEEYPERSSRWEAKLRDAARKIEDIIKQSYFGGDDISSILKFETEKFCLITGDVMDERPAYSSLSLSTSSRIAATGNDVAVGLDEDVMAIKDQLC